jgi:two-component SAPR family response regulator
MKVICVDDERIIMEYTVSMLQKMPMIGEVKGFTNATKSLEYLDNNTKVDLALLDINMPDMNGIELAAEMKQKHPDIAIIFLTGYSQYAVDAFAVRATSYLMKPVTEEKLSDEVKYALFGNQRKIKAHVTVQTFDGFDIFVDEIAVTFKYARCKELLVYLVDRHGNSVTRAEAFSILWEDKPYNRPMQKQFDVIIRSLRTSLKNYGIDRIFELKRGNMRIRPELFTCDAYRFFSGDIDAVNAFHGKYMAPYAWASMTESFMTWKAEEYMASPK